MSKVHLEDESASPPGDRPQDRRRSARAELTVRIDYSTVDEIFSEFTRDINEGGLFIETEKPRLHLPDPFKRRWTKVHIEPDFAGLPLKLSCVLF